MASFADVDPGDPGDVDSPLPKHVRLDALELESRLTCSPPPSVVVVSPSVPVVKVETPQGVLRASAPVLSSVSVMLGAWKVGEVVPSAHVVVVIKVEDRETHVWAETTSVPNVRPETARITAIGGYTKRFIDRSSARTDLQRAEHGGARHADSIDAMCVGVVQRAVWTCRHGVRAALFNNFLEDDAIESLVRQAYAVKLSLVSVAVKPVVFPRGELIAHVEGGSGWLNRRFDRCERIDRAARWFS